MGQWEGGNGGCLEEDVIGAQKLVKGAVVDHQRRMGGEDQGTARDVGGGEETKAFAGDGIDGVACWAGFGRRGRKEGWKRSKVSGSLSGGDKGNSVPVGVGSVSENAESIVGADAVEAGCSVAPVVR